MTQDATARAQELKFDTHQAGGETTVVCSGKIVSVTSPLLVSTVQSYIPESKGITLDLTNVEYVDSSGMGALVKLWISTKRADCGFRVVNLNEKIKDLLRISNLSKILEGDQEYHKYLGG
jgi:anti-anti-sigma factor